MKIESKNITRNLGTDMNGPVVMINVKIHKDEQDRITDVVPAALLLLTPGIVDEYGFTPATSVELSGSRLRELLDILSQLNQLV